MRILNLYAGIGGNRKLWGDTHEVTAIENNEEIAAIYKKNFPNDSVIVADAKKYLLKHCHDYDFYWGSPPCPSHSALRKANKKVEPIYPSMTLYQIIIFLKYFANKKSKWVIENVIPYYDPLIKPSVILGRHLFWTNFYVRHFDFLNSEEPVATLNANKERYGFTIADEKLNHRKDQIVRNLVDPKIGLYLLEQSQKGIKPLFNFNY